MGHDKIKRRRSTPNIARLQLCGNATMWVGMRVLSKLLLLLIVYVGWHRECLGVYLYVILSAEEEEHDKEFPEEPRLNQTLFAVISFTQNVGFSWVLKFQDKGNSIRCSPFASRRWRNSPTSLQENSNDEGFSNFVEHIIMIYFLYLGNRIGATAWTVVRSSCHIYTRNPWKEWSVSCSSWAHVQSVPVPAYLRTICHQKLSDKESFEIEAIHPSPGLLFLLPSPPSPSRSPSPAQGVGARDVIMTFDTLATNATTTTAATKGSAQKADPNRVVRIWRTDQYPIQQWYMLGIFMFLVTAAYLIQLTYAWNVKRLAKNAGQDTKGEVLKATINNKFSLRRIPLAFLNVWRIILYRFTFPLGGGRQMNGAEMIIISSYIVAMFVWTFINSPCLLLLNPVL